MTAYEQIKNSIEMTALVRTVITDNPEEVSLMDLKEEEYKQFRNMYSRKPYEAIRAMNSFLKRLKNRDVKSRHIASAVDLECLVEAEALEKAIGKDNESAIIRGIKGFLTQGYIEMGTDSRNEGRTGQEKFSIDKNRIADILTACKAIGIEEPDEEAAARKIAYLVANLLDYNEEKVYKIWHEHGDNAVRLSKFVDERVGVCRQYEALCQLGLQEAGIYSRKEIGVDFKNNRGHTWTMAKPNGKNMLIDCADKKPWIACGKNDDECYRQTIDMDWLGIKQGEMNFELIDEDSHFFKYSTKGLTE